jgi:hypothetical protein
MNPHSQGARLSHCLNRQWHFFFWMFFKDIAGKKDGRKPGAAEPDNSAVRMWDVGSVCNSGYAFDPSRHVGSETWTQQKIPSSCTVRYG